jgi:hypothetical protein
MNAVERMLAHAERAFRLLGSVYRERDLEGPLWDEAEPLARRAVELLDRDAGWCGWQSRAFLMAAVLRTLDHRPASARPAEAARVYRDLLAERRRLLSPKRVDALLADVVATSTAWGSLSRDVVLRAEAVARALGQLRSIPERWDGQALTFERWGELRHPLRRALARLRALGQPPAAQQQQPTGQRRRRSRAGGRHPKWDAEKRQQLMADRGREERKQKPEMLKTWLTTWANAHEMKRSDVVRMYNATKRASYRAGGARQTPRQS